MRHLKRGRKLGRNASHRKAMFRNMAASMIKTIREFDEELNNAPKYPGRIKTTISKAKELRPFIEKLVTMARKARLIELDAESFGTTAERNSDAWQQWRNSSEWNKWNQAIAPAVALRRRAFAALRDKEAVDILFDEVAELFESRPGGYTRIVRLPNVRLGDAGQLAIIEFVGEDDSRYDRSAKKVAPVVVESDDATDEEDASEEEQISELTDTTDVEESADETSNASDDELEDETAEASEEEEKE